MRPRIATDPCRVNERRLLCLATFVRALATGLIGVLLGVYLAEIGVDAGSIGLILSAGLFLCAKAGWRWKSPTGSLCVGGGPPG